MRDVVHRDSSAVLSAVFHDQHGDEGANGPAVHPLSSPAGAEVQAMIARIERARALSTVLLDGGA